MWTWLASLASIGVAYSATILFLKKKQQRDREHFTNRVGEEERVFVENCGVATGTSAARIAIGVREIIAELGGVPAPSIHAADRFDHELESLKFRSEYHVEDLAQLLKRQLDVSLDRAKLEKLADLEVPPKDFAVKDFVEQVLRFNQQTSQQHS